jgi:hypothetical protein
MNSLSFSRSSLNTTESSISSSDIVDSESGKTDSNQEFDMQAPSVIDDVSTPTSSSVNQVLEQTQQNPVSQNSETFIHDEQRLSDSKSQSISVTEKPLEEQKSDHNEDLKSDVEIQKEIESDDFKSVLSFLDTNGLFTQEEKQNVLKTLESGDAVKLAKVWMTLYSAMFFIDLEFTLPLAIAIGASAGTPVGIAAGATMTAVQMVLANQIVHWQGKGLENEKSLARWAMLPKLGKYLPLAYLLRDHKDFVKFLFVFQRLKKIHTKKMEYDSGSDEYKDLEAEEIEKAKKLLEKFEWIRHQIEFLQERINMLGKKFRLYTRKQNMPLIWFSMEISQKKFSMGLFLLLDFRIKKLYKKCVLKRDGFDCVFGVHFFCELV